MQNPAGGFVDILARHQKMARQQQIHWQAAKGNLNPLPGVPVASLGPEETSLKRTNQEPSRDGSPEPLDMLLKKLEPSSPASALKLAKTLVENLHQSTTCGKVDVDAITVGDAVGDDVACSTSDYDDDGVQKINNDVAHLVEGFVSEVNSLPVHQVTEKDQHALLKKCLMGLKPLVRSLQRKQHVVATVLRMSKQLNCKKITITSEKLNTMLDDLTEANSTPQLKTPSPSPRTRRGRP